jgi:hypothetical protein
MEKISEKQKKEIEFLEELSMRKFSEEEIKEYFDYTVKGIGQKPFGNMVYLARRTLDMAIKQWKEGIAEGTITRAEIEEHYKNNEFLKGIDWDKKHQRHEI